LEYTLLEASKNIRRLNVGAESMNVKEGKEQEKHLNTKFHQNPLRRGLCRQHCVLE
jgi:hypothetical protein